MELMEGLDEVSFGGYLVAVFSVFCVGCAYLNREILRWCSEMK